jgi:hypothetical protein
MQQEKETDIKNIHNVSKIVGAISKETNMVDYIERELRNQYM